LVFAGHDIDYTLKQRLIVRQLDPVSVAPPDPIELNGRTLAITGTAGADRIDLRTFGNETLVTLNDQEMWLLTGDFDKIEINAGDGDDLITIGHGVMGCFINGGNGNDTIVGGDFADTINGNAGKDRIDGGLGDDRLAGNGGNDAITG